MNTTLWALTNGYPSAYPNQDVAAAFVLCVPRAGHGWISNNGERIVYSNDRESVPMMWEEYANDTTVVRYLEATRAPSLISKVPDGASLEWVRICLRLVSLAETLPVNDRTKKRFRKIGHDLTTRFPDASEPVKPKLDFEEIKARILAAAPREDQPAEDKPYGGLGRKFYLSMVKDVFEHGTLPAQDYSPKTAAAALAITDAGGEYLFEKEVKPGRGCTYRIVVHHPDRPNPRDRVGDLMKATQKAARSGPDYCAQLAREIYDDKDYAKWLELRSWRDHSMAFGGLGGIDAYTDDPESGFYNAMVNLQSGPFKWPLIERAIEIFGEPTVEGNVKTFVPLRPPHHYNEHPIPAGLQSPRRSYPYLYDNWQDAKLPEYAPARYYSGWQLLIEGIVVPIGNKRYRVRYPLVEKLLNEPEDGYDYGDYPNETAPVILEETTDPETPYSDSGEIQFFGSPHWVQNPRYPVWKGRAGYVLFLLDDNWGDCGNTHILFCEDENGEPVRLFHEASCS